MRIDLQCAPQVFRCHRIVACVHRFRRLFEICVHLHFLARWGGRVGWNVRLSCDTMHEQEPHGTDSHDLPGSLLYSHTPNSTPWIDMAKCSGSRVRAPIRLTFTPRTFLSREK